MTFDKGQARLFLVVGLPNVFFLSSFKKIGQKKKNDVASQCSSSSRYKKYDCSDIFGSSGSKEGLEKLTTIFLLALVAMYKLKTNYPVNLASGITQRGRKCPYTSSLKDDSQEIGCS